MYSIVKSLFYKAKEEGKDLFKCLMIYCSTLLSCSLQSLMKILQSRRARSDLPMSNADRQQLVLQPEKLRNVNKNQHFTSHDLCMLGKMLCTKMLQASSAVSSHYYQFMCAAKKLQYYYKRRCHLQEDTRSLEALPTTKKKNQKMNILLSNLVICRH